MAETTQFDHDRISHLLADRFLRVPKFQRAYSWDRSNVDEYLSDLTSARRRGGVYFMGTVVFAHDKADTQRQLVVDGQQRLTTTAVLLIAARDLLNRYAKKQQGDHIDDTYLRSFDPDVEDTVERLLLNPNDQPTYEQLLTGTLDPGTSNMLVDCYRACSAHLAELAPTSADYRNILDVTRQLNELVQVLVAVASDLPEAYVIFETLNDRGADLTTADLLKNYLFSQAKDYFDQVQQGWDRIASRFEDPKDLVRFIKHEHASRKGRITTRKLYRAIQVDIGEGPRKAKTYVARLEKALKMYLALEDVDNPIWLSLSFEVRESVLAFRRFQFESSVPLLLAAYANWGEEKAARLLNKVVGWSIRAQLAGKLGGGTSEEAFANAAKAVTEGVARNQSDVLGHLSSIVTSDDEFMRDFARFGRVSPARAKYLLAMIEKAHREKIGLSTDALPDWNGRGVTIDHIAPKNPSSSSNVKSVVEQIGNMTLLEKTHNRNLGSKAFTEKTSVYAKSNFETTKTLTRYQYWDDDTVLERANDLAELAGLAWPLR